MQVRINSHVYELNLATGSEEILSGHMRDVITLNIVGDYNSVAADFVDGATFTIVEPVQIQDEEGGVTVITQEHEHTDHTVAGPITDNRDGTVVVKMGKTNTKEQDALDKAAAAEAETAKVSQDLVTLAGKPIQESEVSSLRASFENAANKLSDDDAKIAPSLTTAWNMGQQVSTGQRRYYAPDGNLYKALQDHTTSISTSPDTATDYWVLL